jgi:hypothetical protein
VIRGMLKQGAFGRAAADSPWPPVTSPNAKSPTTRGIIGEPGYCPEWAKLPGDRTIDGHLYNWPTALDLMILAVTIPMVVIHALRLRRLARRRCTHDLSAANVRHVTAFEALEVVSSRETFESQH